MIGFAVTKENPPGSGIWVDSTTERKYFGDVNRMSKRWESASQVNDNFNVNHEFSIVADPFANDNFASIKYIVWMNQKWKVTGAEIQYPRLILSIGGLYNG